ncbi:unnamed protein product [Closterium sp. NIES-53]
MSQASDEQKIATFKEFARTPVMASIFLAIPDDLRAKYVGVEPTADGTFAPPAGTSAPAGATFAPTAGTLAPAGATSAPAGSTYAPPAGTTSHAGTTSAPAGATFARTAATSAPAGATFAPPAGTSAPAGWTYPPPGHQSPRAAGVPRVSRGGIGGARCKKAGRGARGSRSALAGCTPGGSTSAGGFPVVPHFTSPLGRGFLPFDGIRYNYSGFSGTQGTETSAGGFSLPIGGTWATSGALYAPMCPAYAPGDDHPVPMQGTQSTTYAVSAPPIFGPAGPSIGMTAVERQAGGVFAPGTGMYVPGGGNSAHVDGVSQLVDTSGSGNESAL